MDKQEHPWHELIKARYRQVDIAKEWHGDAAVAEQLLVVGRPDGQEDVNGEQNVGDEEVAGIASGVIDGFQQSVGG